MPRKPRRPTYEALILDLEHALECLAAALGSIALPGRVRWRLIRCRDRIQAAIRAARQEDQ